MDHKEYGQRLAAAIADLLEEARQERDYSYAQAGDRAGLTAAQVWRHLGPERRAIPIHILPLLCEAVGTDMNTVITEANKRIS